MYIFKKIKEYFLYVYFFCHTFLLLIALFYVFYTPFEFPTLSIAPLFLGDWGILTFIKSFNFDFLLFGNKLDIINEKLMLLGQINDKISILEEQNVLLLKKISILEKQNVLLLKELNLLSTDSKLLVDNNLVIREF